MAKRMRVYELARELGVDSKLIMNFLTEQGIQVSNHMTAIDEAVCDKIRERFKPAAKPQKSTSAPSSGAQGAVQRLKQAEQPKPATVTKTEVRQEPKVVKQGAPNKESKPVQRANQHVQKQSGAEPRPRQQEQQRPKAAPEKQAPGARKVVIQGDTSVRELASLIGVSVPQCLRALMGMGVLANINQSVSPEVASKVAAKFGCAVTVKEPEKSKEEIILEELEAPDDPAKAVPRPPVVTVMGHVDHGKTSLLDAIRHTNVTATEAGGITQHIGASVVEHNGQKIIFLDTPGHEAFTEMRARGARVTDVAVLVVAADDGVMPQTVEAMNHAKAAGVPIVVAINKIDKPGANPQRVKQQLSEIGLVPEEWGGDTVTVEVSARTRKGIDDLLEMILLVAEMQELKADPTRRARGYIIESRMDKGKGPVATALVRTGQLKVGDIVLTDTTWGRIRAMYDGRGRQVKKAGPSTPVELVGLEELPQAGDSFLVIDDDKLAKEVTERRKMAKREQEMEATHRMTLEEFFKKQDEDKKKELKLILKSDVQGSLEAIIQALGKLEQNEVQLSVIHSGVGAIIESDVMLAKASHATILGFNVRPDNNARAMAENDNVEIRTYRIIYDLLDDVQNMLKGLVKPRYEEVILGRAEIRQTFHVPKIGNVAGCYVQEGKITRQAGVRLLRDGVVVYEGKIASLRRYKDDVSEVGQGFECGIGLERFQDVKPGDIIEAFTQKQVQVVERT